MMKERVKAELTVTKIGTIFGSEEVSYYFEDTNMYGEQEARKLGKN